jgi:dTDP-4-dehydrorhamnose reductase
MTFGISPAAPIPLPLLVTGVAGVPGYNAFHYFRARYPGQVVGIRQRDNPRITGAGVEPCDAEDIDTLRRLFERHHFRSVLDCAGNCALRACELDAERAWRINVGGVRNLLDVITSTPGPASSAGTSAISTVPIRLVHLSVDLVYSGDGYGGYVETDPTDPVTVYGETMVASEQIVAERYPSACMLRISLPMGVSSNGHAGAIDWIQSRFKKHRPATLYFDEYRTPHYTDCLNELCEVLLADESTAGGRPPLAGIYHAGGPRPYSLFEIAQVINRVGGYDPDLLMGCPRLHAGPIPPRAGNCVMDTSKLTTALGYNPFDPWPVDPAFHPTDRLWHYRRRGQPGSPELLSQILYRNPRRHAP